MAESEETVDYKALYEQLSNENVELRLHIFKLENVKESFSQFRDKIGSLFNNPVKMYAYCYVAIVATYILTSLVDMMRKRND